MKQRICQSSGMSMPADDLLGTHGNGCLCTEYCWHCFQKGFLTNHSLQEQIELNTLPYSLAGFNIESGCNFTKAIIYLRTAHVPAYAQTLDAYPAGCRMGA